jgi:hypothetical protein
MKYPKTKPAVITYPTVDAVAAAIITYDPKGLVKGEVRVLLQNNSERITQEHKDKAQEMIDYIGSTISMDILSDRKVSAFNLDLAKLFGEETVPENKLGLLAYAPSVFDQMKKREVIVEQTLESMYLSRALGSEGTKVSIKFELIEYKYVQIIDCFAAFGKDEFGNLISFLTRNEELCATQPLVGKVKKAELDKWHQNVMVTSLNFVKVPKVKI